MQTINHADILNAYLSRLTDADISAIANHATKSTNEWLNGNRNSQAQAQAGFYAAVCNAVNNLCKYDIELIENKLGG